MLQYIEYPYIRFLSTFRVDMLASKVSFLTTQSAISARRTVLKTENIMPSSKKVYSTTSLATEHPALAGLELKHGNYKTLGESPLGKALCEVMKSEAVALSLVTSQIVAPSRPPIVAIGKLLKHSFGEKVFEPDFKRLTGRYVRQVLEQLDFSWKRSGVDVVVKNSEYASGSIYRANTTE